MQLVPSPREDTDGTDVRVAAVLEVLAGARNGEVAQRFGVEPVLLRRWVRAFVEAGTAQVTNNPLADEARRRDRFLATFAHELRTPLAIAMGWVSMMVDSDCDPDETRPALERVDEALGRLHERVRDVELLAASSLGRVQLSLTPVTVGELAADLGRLGPVGGEGPDVRLLADATLMPRVLRDLAWAAELPPEPLSVRVQSHLFPDWVEIRMQREGPPIDHVVLQSLFDPFDLNDDDTGVTIGLYLARALVVAHGGTLGLEQDEQGAVLWVRLPRRTSRQTRTNTTQHLEEE